MTQKVQLRSKPKTAPKKGGQRASINRYTQSKAVQPATPAKPQPTFTPKPVQAPGVVIKRCSDGLYRGWRDGKTMGVPLTYDEFFGFRLPDVPAESHLSFIHAGEPYVAGDKVTAEYEPCDCKPTAFKLPGKKTKKLAAMQAASMGSSCLYLARFVADLTLQKPMPVVPEAEDLIAKWVKDHTQPVAQPVSVEIERVPVPKSTAKVMLPSKNERDWNKEKRMYRHH